MTTKHKINPAALDLCREWAFKCPACDADSSCTQDPAKHNKILCEVCHEWIGLDENIPFDDEE